MTQFRTATDVRSTGDDRRPTAGRRGPTAGRDRRLRSCAGGPARATRVRGPPICRRRLSSSPGTRRESAAKQRLATGPTTGSLVRGSNVVCGRRSSKADTGTDEQALSGPCRRRGGRRARGPRSVVHRRRGDATRLLLRPVPNVSDALPAPARSNQAQYHVVRRLAGPGGASNLSARELAVVRYLPSRLSSAEIAEHLYISTQHAEDPPPQHLPQARGRGTARGDREGQAARHRLTSWARLPRRRPAAAGPPDELDTELAERRQEALQGRLIGEPPSQVRFVRLAGAHLETFEGLREGRPETPADDDLVLQQRSPRHLRSTSFAPCCHDAVLRALSSSPHQHDRALRRRMPAWRPFAEAGGETPPVSRPE